MVEAPISQFAEKRREAGDRLFNTAKAVFGIAQEWLAFDWGETDRELRLDHDGKLIFIEGTSDGSVNRIEVHFRLDSQRFKPWLDKEYEYFQDENGDLKKIVKRLTGADNFYKSNPVTVSVKEINDLRDDLLTGEPFNGQKLLRDLTPSG